jgi:endoglucanase
MTKTDSDKQRFSVRFQRETYLFDEDAIVGFKSHQHQTYLVTEDGEYLHKSPLKDLEKTLNPSRFLRVNRQAIINLDHVESWSHKSHFNVKMMNEWSLRVSKARQRLVKSRLQKHTEPNLHDTLKLPPFKKSTTDHQSLRDGLLWINPIRRKQISSIATADASYREILDHISQQPVAYWLKPDANDIYQSVRGIVKRAKLAKAIPVLVSSYFQLEGNTKITTIVGNQNLESIAQHYQAWIHHVAQGIGSYPAILVLEPNLLAQLVDAPGPIQTRLIKSIWDAIQLLRFHSGARIYLDAGHPAWIPAEQMAVMLGRSAIDLADGFVVNTTNFIENERNIAFGEAISSRLGDKPFIIDTSRNGQGPYLDEYWCNPPGRGLGRLPTLNTKHPLIDALLWIKPPGESDGPNDSNESNVPPAGTFWLNKALELGRFAGSDRDTDIL